MDALNVEVALTANHAADDAPFSETICRSYRLTRAEFHQVQRAIAGVLLGFGDRAVRAKSTPGTRVKAGAKKAPL